MEKITSLQLLPFPKNSIMVKYNDEEDTFEDFFTCDYLAMVVMDYSRVCPVFLDTDELGDLGVLIERESDSVICQAVNYRDVREVCEYQYENSPVSTTLDDVKRKIHAKLIHAGVELTEKAEEYLKTE